MKTLGRAIKDYLSDKAVAGGYSWDPGRIASVVEKVVFSLLPVPVIIYLVTKSLIVSLILIPMPVIPIVLTIVWASYSVDSVKENVEWELPFFMVLLDIVHDVGGDITHAFEISGRVGLKWINREWFLIRRYSLTTNSLIKAMQLRARIHPSIEFQRFMNSYVSVWGYSGDVTSYVRSVESTYLSMLNSKLSALSRQIIDIVLAVVSSVVILILFVIITTILGLNYAILYIMPAMSLLLPAFIIRVYQSIPYIIRIDLKHDRNLYLIIGLSALLSVAAIMYLGINGLISLVIPPLLFSILVARRINDVKSSVLSLPDVVRDISEIVKAGVSIGAAIERVLDNPYPRTLLTYLRRITQFNDDARIDGPWIIKYAINLLREVSNLGSPSRALDKLVEVFLELKALIMNINYNARSLQLLNYSLPFVFAGVTYIGRFVVSSLNSVIKNTPYTLVGLAIPNLNAILMPLLITAYIISISVALLSSLISDLTLNPSIKSVMPIPLTLALMLVAVEIPLIA